MTDILDAPCPWCESTDVGACMLDGGGYGAMCGGCLATGPRTATAAEAETEWRRLTTAIALLYAPGVFRAVTIYHDHDDMGV